MLKNYFRTAWRSLVNNRFYSIINILGLTLGLAVGLLVLLWVQDELGYDAMHRNGKNIYRLAIESDTKDSKQIFEEIIAPIATFAKQELPNVQNAVRIKSIGTSPLFQYKDKKFTENGKCAFIDASFFSVFDFPLVKGDAKNPFPDSYSIVITESSAIKYFGNDDPIGKVITGNGKMIFKVTGVIKDFPENSSIRYNMLFPLSLFNKMSYVDGTRSYNGTGRIASLDADWVDFGYEVYLLMRPGSDLRLTEKKLAEIHVRNKPDDYPVPYLMQPLSKIHLYRADGADAGIGTVKIFSIVALLILAIACINYVNLSTARAMLRAKEVSIRKIIGAARLQLFLQFITETAFIFCIAAAFALVLMVLIMPVYNHFSGKQLSMNFSNHQIWTVIAVTLFSTLAASSLYPAILLSSFKPLKALRGKITAGIGTATFRRILVVTQFSASVVLIIGTFVISSQLGYIYKKKLGFDKDRVLLFQVSRLDQHYDAIRSELLKQPGIADVARSSDNIVDVGNWTGDNDWDGKPVNLSLYLHPIDVDQHFIPFYKLQMAGGSNFTGAVSDSAHFILNETAVQEMGLKDAIGKRLRIRQTTGTITGIIKDFHFASMRKKIEPAVFIYNPKDCWQLSVRATNNGVAEALRASGAVWKQYNNDIPFNYVFLDQTFEHLYKSEQQTGSLFNIFAAIAVVISCLGLFGLATYTAQVKTREIGIRKVLGSSVVGIVRLLSTDFLKLIAVAIIIAIPVAWWSMHNWLEGFAFRINMGWWIFVAAAILTVAIALLTISFQAIRAALANPVKSLRTE